MVAQRVSHVLKPTTKIHRPTNVIFFDTETTPSYIGRSKTLHELRLGVAVYCRTVRGDRLKEQREIVFKTSAELWDFVDGCVRDHSTVYLVAHNIIFDLAVAAGFIDLAERGWTLDSFYTKAITSIFRWSQDKKKLIGVDNTNLFPGKLSAWGERFEIPKLDVDFDTAGIHDLITYCRRDVEIMIRCWRSWLSFLDDHDCGTFKCTVASTAFNTWRHRFMGSRVHIHTHNLAVALERESYRGGRVECLFQGSLNDSHYYYLDVNSMYGYVLSRYQYPCGLYKAVEHGSIDYLAKKLLKYAVIARVTVNVDRACFPIIHKKHICYPLGEFRTTLTTPELLEALHNGWIVDVHAISWYRQGQLFSDYIHEFHRLRVKYQAAGDVGYAFICKMLVNSLYGKFGQWGIEQQRIGDIAIDQVWRTSVINHQTGEVYRQIALAGGVYEEHKSGEGYHSFVAIAAHVTAYARLYLWRLTQQVTPKHVYYMDTDSMIVDQVGFEELLPIIDENRLGYLKVEHAADDLTIYAPKDYKMDGRVRIKGVSADAVEVRSNVYKQTQWYRLAGMIREGQLSGALTRELVKHQHRVIHSGVVGPDGWVRPYRLTEGVRAPLLFPVPSPVASESPSE